MRLLHRDGLLMNEALTRITGLVGPNIAAGRLSGITRRFVESGKTIPAFGNFPGRCNSPFPDALYASMGSRIMRNVPGSVPLGRNSVISISYNACVGKFYKSSTCAFYMKRISPRILGLLGAAGRTLCLNVRGTVRKGHLNSVNFTIRRRYRTGSCNIMERFMNRNVKGSVRRSPRMPGCKGEKCNARLGGNVYVTVRPVVALNSHRVMVRESK